MIDAPVAINAKVESSFGKIFATSLKLYTNIHKKANRKYNNIDFMISVLKIIKSKTVI